MSESQAAAIIQSLRAAYIRSLANKLVEFNDAAKVRNFRTVTRLGHQLKGSGLSYGIPEISDLGARIEDAGENRRVVLLDSLLSEFVSIMNCLTQESSTTENA